MVGVLISNDVLTKREANILVFCKAEKRGFTSRPWVQGVGLCDDVERTFSLGIDLPGFCEHDLIGIIVLCRNHQTGSAVGTQVVSALDFHHGLRTL